MSDDAAALRDAIEALTRSLDDARREHERGELDDAGLAQIEDRDGARLAAATARLAALGAGATAVTVAAEPAAGSPGAPRRRRSLLVVAAGCVAVVVLVLCLAAADPFARSPVAPRDTPATTVAGLDLSGELLLGEGHPLRALTAFDAALRLSPRNPEALVESAWLRYEFVGLGGHDPAQTALGLAELRRAVRVAPHDAGAHLYYGIALLRVAGGRAQARRQLLAAAALPETADEQSLTATMLAYVARG